MSERNGQYDINPFRGNKKFTLIFLKEKCHVFDPRKLKPISTKEM